MNATLSAALDAGEATVRPEWIDYNGHMNVAYYVLAIDNALDRVFDALGVGEAWVKRTNMSFFVAEAHVTYAREVKEGDRLRFSFQMLGMDAKRLHYFMTMHHAQEGFLSATSEQIALHVDLGARKSAEMAGDVRERFEALMAGHRGLPVPPQAGRVIGIRRTGAAA